MKKSFLLVLIALNSCLSYSQSVKDYRVKTEANAVERQAILDILRKEIYQDLKQKVVFQVSHFKISGNYAWVEATALRSDGKELVFPEADYDCCHVEGLFKLVKGTWKEVEMGLFTTDCWYCKLADRYPKVPKSIFTPKQL